jgi:hypothetical protein
MHVFILSLYLLKGSLVVKFFENFLFLLIILTWRIFICEGRTQLTND